MTKNKKILLVELVEGKDKECDSFIEKFIKAGFDVFKSSTEKEILKNCLSYKPDLVFLYVCMPSVHGVNAMKDLCDKHLWASNLPVVFYSNIDPNNEEINKFITKQEPSYYLSKSRFTPDQAVEKVKECL